MGWMDMMGGMMGGFVPQQQFVNIMPGDEEGWAAGAMGGMVPPPQPFVAPQAQGGGGGGNNWLANAIGANALRDARAVPPGSYYGYPGGGGGYGGGRGGGGGAGNVQYTGSGDPSSFFQQAKGGGNPYGSYMNSLYGQQYAQQQNASATAANLYAQMQGQYNQAKAANEQRYNQLLQENDATRDQSLGVLNNLSNQQVKDIGNQYTQQEQQAQQGAISRGLGNTTVTDSLQRGLESDKTAAVNRAQDALAQQRLGVIGQYNQQRAGIMERRTDAYPDQSQMLQLAMMAGAGGAAPRAAAPANYGGYSYGSYGYPGYGYAQTGNSYGGGPGVQYTGSGNASSFFQPARR